MKFQGQLEYYQNLQAWRKHHEKSTQTQYNEISHTEKACLMNLNEILQRLEDQYLPILDAKLKELQVRVNNPSDWLMDFNLSYTITFYLHESDPEFDADDDNILMQILNDHFVREVSKDDWGFGATHINHAESVSHFLNERHCYTYHNLYDHYGLDWRDLLRIGCLNVDIHIDEQSGAINCPPLNNN